MFVLAFGFGSMLSHYPDQQYYPQVTWWRVPTLYIKKVTHLTYNTEPVTLPAIWVIDLQHSNINAMFRHWGVLRDMAIIQ